MKNALLNLSLLTSSVWSPISGGITAPDGFLAAGISAGLKLSGKKDLALLYAPDGACCSGTFTQSMTRAYCVDLCICLLYTSPSPRDKRQSRMPSSA